MDAERYVELRKIAIALGDLPQPGRYVADIDSERERFRPEDPMRSHFAAQVHWPVLTPDGGLLMCSTEADALRVALELNELLDRVERMQREIADLGRELRTAKEWKHVRNA